MNVAKQLMRKNRLHNVFILFLLIAIYLASSWGFAYVSAIQPHQLMLKWATNKRPFSEKQWHAAVYKMHAVVNDNPNNAQYSYDLARLYELAAYQYPIWNNEAITHRTKAIELYKRTLALRPTWSSVWAEIAMSQTVNLQFGDEVKKALSNALIYGPWEQGVFHKVLWVSIANWEAMPAELKAQIENRISETVDGKRQVPRYIHETAKNFNWQDRLNKIIDKTLQNHKTGKDRLGE